MIHLIFRDRVTGKKAGEYNLPLGYPISVITTLTDAYGYDAEVVKVTR